VHDDRGNASVEWADAPPDDERTVLEIESSGIHRRLHVGDPGSCNPYSSPGPLKRKRPPQSTGGTSRTDLRKLSEWIKMMRELEQRRQSGETDD